MTERTLSRSGAQIRVFSDLPELYAAAMEGFFRVVADAIAERGVCNVALSGGSTPKALYALIKQAVAEHRAAPINWEKVHFFFGDERCVPPEHPDSNYRMAMESLFAGGVLPTKNVHRVMAELPPKEAAQKYEDELRKHFGDVLGSSGFPEFDLILLGLGPDGHTASLFPGSAGLEEKKRWVIENWVEKFKQFRITFTFPVLNHAREVMFLAAGAEKQTAMQQVFAVPPQAPAGHVRPANGELLWLVTQDAAQELS